MIEPLKSIDVAPRHWRFGSFRLNVDDRLLSRAGEPLTLPPRTFDLLVVLARNAGRLVTKEQLNAEVWQGAFVSDGALTQAVWRLRQALGEGSGLDLQSVQRVGYRLVGPVEALTAALPSRPVAVPAQALGATRRRWWPLAAVVLGLGAISLVGVGLRGVFAPPVATLRYPPTVVIPPFRSLGPAGQDAWLGTALAEMLSSELGSGGGVEVVAPERLAREVRGTPALLPPGNELARALGAEFLVVGTYLLTRSAGGEDAELRIDVRVLDAASGRSRDAFDGHAGLSNLIDLIEIHGPRIRSGLGLAPAVQVDATLWSWVLPLTPAARESFFDGLARRRQGDALGARRSFEQALAQAPDDPLVQQALAVGCADLGEMTCATRASERAVAASAGLPAEGRLWIEATAASVRADWTTAAARFEALANLVPANLEYPLELAPALARAGRGADALALLDEIETRPAADRGDPRLPLVRARVHQALGDPRAELAAARAASERARARGALGLEFQAELLAAEAGVLSGADQGGWRSLEKLREAAARTPRSAQDLAATLRVTGEALLRQGRFDEAQASAEEALTLWRGLGYRRPTVETLGLLSSIAYFRGRLEQASRLMEQMAREAAPLADPALRARLLMNRAGVRVEVGDLAEAEALVREAREIYLQVGHQMGRVGSGLRLVQVLSDRGALAEADQRVEELAVPAAKIGGEIVRESQYWRARVDFAQGRFDAARAGFTRLLRPESAAEPHRALAGSELMLGILELAAGNSELACRHLETAWRSFRDLEQEASSDEAEAIFARCLLERGAVVDAAARFATTGRTALGSESFLQRAEWGLTAALLDAAQGRPAAARERLDELEGAGLAAGVRYHVYDVRLARARLESDPARRRAALLAVAAQADGDRFPGAALEARRLAGL